MTDYHPITSWFRNLQITVLPDEMNNNIASSWIQIISDTTKHEGDGVDDWLIREVASRLAALALPVFVALATIQLAGVLTCQAALMILGQDHKDLDQCFYDLLRMIGALFTSVIAWPFSVIDPKVYQRTPKQEVPQKDPEPKVEDIKKDKLPTTSSSEQSKESIYKTLKKCVRGKSHIETDFHDTFTSISTCGALTLANDKNHWESTTPLETSEQVKAFLVPKGTIEARLDCLQECDLKTNMSLLQDIDRLVLKKAKIQDVIDLDDNSPLSQIHTLVLDSVDCTETDLTKIAEKFPNIACFDLSRCVFDKEIEQLDQSHIVCFPSIPNPKIEKKSTKVAFHFSNAEKQYKDLNTKLCDQSFYKQIQDYYSQKEPKKPFHPAAPFVTELGLFRYTGIKMGDIRGANTEDSYNIKFFKGRGLIQVFSKIFPNMTCLDFEGCPELVLDQKTLHYFHSPTGLPPTITRISFKNCSNLFKDYPDEAIEAFLRALVSMKNVIAVNIENTAHMKLEKAKMEEIVKSMMVHVENILQYEKRVLHYTDTNSKARNFKRE